MKKIRALIVITGLVLVLPLPSSADAQVRIDASKITCDQFVHGKVGVPRTVAAWLSGFYNGKRDSSVLDIREFEKDVIKLQDFCYQEKNFDLPVMQAIDQAIVNSK